jgi:DNA repair protein RadD
VISLHAFQQTAVEEIEKTIEEGKRRLLYVAPTGAGKTVVGAEIINRAVERHHRVLVIAHRREIITQTRDKLVASGVNPGIVLAGFEDELRPYANVQVAGIQTLHARAIRSNRMPMPAATYLIIDEAHHARASSYQKVLDAYRDAVVIGLTATPVGYSIHCDLCPYARPCRPCLSRPPPGSASWRKHALSIPSRGG